MAKGLVRFLRHQPLERGFGPIMSRNAKRVEQNSAEKLAQEWEVPMSTIRNPGGATSNSRGTSPDWTQRQNFFSAMKRVLSCGWRSRQRVSISLMSTAAVPGFASEGVRNA